jgi:hypothetical protein
MRLAADGDSLAVAQGNSGGVRAGVGVGGVRGLGRFVTEASPMPLSLDAGQGVRPA